MARNPVRKYLITAQSCGLTRDGPSPTESQLLILVQLNKAGPRQVAEPTDEVLEPWGHQIEQWLRQAFKLLRMGEKYTPARLNAACERALAVDLIDVRRLENILVKALEEEAMPVMSAPAPPGRFAHPGNVFAQASNYGDNHHGDQS